MGDEKFKIECTGNQLALIANCLEDCHRFMTGQMELYNMTSMLAKSNDAQEKLMELHEFVVPELNKKYGLSASYSWNGIGCPNKYQREFIAKTYAIYREIYHFFALIDNRDNCYTSDTLICDNNGGMIKIEKI